MLIFLSLHILSLVNCEICPKGYWPSIVSSASPGKSIGDYSSERKFSLPYGPNGNSPTCRYCPGVSCFIMQQESKVYKEKHESRRRPRPHPSPSATTTPNLPALGDLFTVFDNLTSTKSPETHEEGNIQMSCAHLSDLPFPSRIITYLDCVQIGQADLFYLFIYKPMSQEAKSINVVDCVDPDFLKWIPKNVKLLGLELGFPMRRLPPYFLRYYKDLMKPTQQICVDSSELSNNEIDNNDMHRFSGKALIQVVFRHDGLQRNRLPPKQPENTVLLSHNSSEVVEDCPEFADSEYARTYPDVDCRYAASDIPTSTGILSNEEVVKNCYCPQCTYEKPVIKVTRIERKFLPVPRYVKTLLNMALLALVLLLIFGTVLSFCIQNRDKAMLLFLTRGRKRRREMEEALAAEAAERAAKEAEEANQANWNPLFGRYGISAMSGFGGGGAIAYGPFAGRIQFPAAHNEPANPVETPTKGGAKGGGTSNTSRRAY